MLPLFMYVSTGEAVTPASIFNTVLFTLLPRSSPESYSLLPLNSILPSSHPSALGLTDTKPDSVSFNVVVETKGQEAMSFLATVGSFLLLFYDFCGHHRSGPAKDSINGHSREC